jgi:hypothetical protein
MGKVAELTPVARSVTWSQEANSRCTYQSRIHMAAVCTRIYEKYLLYSANAEECVNVAWVVSCRERVFGG